jgi:hypothetical protein
MYGLWVNLIPPAAPHRAAPAGLDQLGHRRVHGRREALGVAVRDGALHVEFI